MADNSGNFWGGFLLGAAIGGAVGALVAIKLTEPEDEIDDRQSDRVKDKPQTSSEFARRNLEKKIAQLNAAIDSVSQELTTAEGKNGRSSTAVESLRDLNSDDKRS